MNKQIVDLSAAEQQAVEGGIAFALTASFAFGWAVGTAIYNGLIAP